MDELLNHISAQFIIDNLPNMAIVVDGYAKIRRLNKSAMNQLNIQEEKYSGAHISSLIGNIPKRKTVFTKLYRDNFIVIPDNGESVYASGTVVPLNGGPEYHGALFLLNDIGRLIGVMKRFTAGKKFLERTLKAKGKRDEFHSIIESLHEGVMVMNDTYEIIHVNHVLEEWTGKKRDQIIGGSLSAVFPDIAKLELIQQYKYFESQEITVTNLQTGKSRLVELSLAPVKVEESEKLGVALTFRVLSQLELKWPKIQGVLNNEILPVLDDAAVVLREEVPDENNLSKKLEESSEFVKKQLLSLVNIIKDD